MTNVIGDIAGQYKTLLALVKKMPEGEVISVGDMIDRGPQSKEVLEYFMQPDRRATMGNHEHLMLDHLDAELGPYGYYEPGIWTMNGGGHTLDSYQHQIPSNIKAWVRTLPFYIEVDNYLISHAFIHSTKSLEEACELGTSARDPNCNQSIIWNRNPPIRRDWELQITGHNAHWGLNWFSDDQGNYGVCIDTSYQKILTGIHLPTQQIYQQPYIE